MIAVRVSSCASVIAVREFRLSYSQSLHFSEPPFLRTASEPPMDVTVSRTTKSLAPVPKLLLGTTVVRCCSRPLFCACALAVATVTAITVSWIGVA